MKSAVFELDRGRRRVAAIALVAGAGAALGLPIPSLRAAAPEAAPKRSTFFEWTEIAPGARVAMGQGGNTLALTESNDKTLIIDTKNAGFGRTLLRETREFAQNLRGVVNTHHHADHTGGNSAFTLAHAPIYAHANAAPRIRAQHERYLSSIRAAAMWLKQEDAESLPAGVLKDVEAVLADLSVLTPERFAPTSTINADRLELTVSAALVVELAHFGPGHTDNDLVVEARTANCVHAGDLIFNGLHPYVDVAAGADTRGWRHSLRRMLALTSQGMVVVPGHGPLGDRSIIQAQIDYFDTLEEFVRQAIDDGRERDEIIEMTPDSLRQHGLTRLLPIALGAVHDELVEG